VNSGGEDWKKRLKALGIARKRRPKRKNGDFLRRKEGEGPADASGSPEGEAPRSSPFEEISPRTLQRVKSGQEGENLASLFLEENSFRILARNVRYRDGEIDIVALDGATTVFVEVKRRRVVRAARRWLAAHPARGGSVRFDVVAIRDEPASVTWIKAAFDSQGPA
jgi:putative endonuclease